MSKKKAIGWWKLIEFPVFSNYCVHLVVAYDLTEAMRRYVHTKNVVLDDPGAACSIHVKSIGLTYIFIKPNSPIGDIVHECWHAVHRMMGYVGVDIDSETVAYHLGYLAEQVITEKRIPWGKESK